MWRLASSQASSHIGGCTFVETVKETLARQGLFLTADQVSRCLEISREISTIEVLPVNSNFTFPSDEK